MRPAACEVVNHGPDYADFESGIVPGHYGAGVAMLRDRDTFEPNGDSVADLGTGEVTVIQLGQTLGGRCGRSKFGFHAGV